MTRHNRQLPSPLALANHPGKVLHRFPRKEVAPRGCYCNEMPARLLGVPLAMCILGLRAEGSVRRTEIRSSRRIAHPARSPSLVEGNQDLGLLVGSRETTGKGPRRL